MLSKAKSLKYHLYCALLNAPPLLIGRKTRIRILRSLGATIGDNVFVSHLTRIPYGYPNLRIESGTSVQAEELLLLDSVSIGRNTCIGRGVHILSASHEIDSETFAHKRAPIVIGDFVYIGNGAIILPGVTVGNYAIVGAGAVVTKSVPDYAVVAGNPARVIKNRAVKEYAYSPGSNAYLR